MDDPLLRTVLETVPVCDVELERLLTALRVLVLAGAVRGQPPVRRGDMARIQLRARAAVLHQRVRVRGDGDRTATRSRACADASPTAAQSGGEIAPHLIAAVAAYAPLHSSPDIDALLDRPWPVPVAELLTQQVREPREEQRAARDDPEPHADRR